MLKRLIPAILVLPLAACGSLSGHHDPASLSSRLRPTETRNTTLMAVGNGVSLVLNAQGQWVRLSAQGSAVFDTDTPVQRQTALMVATLRAKRALIDFLSEDMASGQTVSRIAKQLASLSGKGPEDLTAGNNGQSEDSMRTAATLAERIHEQSAMILRGAYVSQSRFTATTALVDVTVTPRSIGAAESIAQSMGVSP